MALLFFFVVQLSTNGSVNLNMQENLQGMLMHGHVFKSPQEGMSIRFAPHLTTPEFQFSMLFYDICITRLVNC